MSKDKDNLPVTLQGMTVPELKAKKLADLVIDGVPLKEAAKRARVTKAELRRAEFLRNAVGSLLQAAQAADVLNDETRQRIAKARLAELMLQEDNPKLALQAIRTELGVGVSGRTVGNAVQINFMADDNVKRAQEALEVEFGAQGQEQQEKSR